METLTPKFHSLCREIVIFCHFFRYSKLLLARLSVNFEEMSISSHSSEKLLLRRLSGPSYVREPSNKSSTQWVWYWQDKDGWKKYAETLVSGSFPCLDGKRHRGTRGGRLSCPQTLPPFHTHTNRQHINKLQ